MKNIKATFNFYTEVLGSEERAHFENGEFIARMCDWDKHPGMYIFAFQNDPLMYAAEKNEDGKYYKKRIDAGDIFRNGLKDFVVLRRMTLPDNMTIAFCDYQNEV